MSNNEQEYKYGEVNFFEIREFNKATIQFTIIPYVYLAQDIKNPQKIYLFRTYKEMEDYFADGTKPKY